MLEFDVVFWLFYDAGPCISYKLGAALIYTLFILAVQKCIFSHNNDPRHCYLGSLMPGAFNHIYMLAMHLVELMICTITSHYVIIKEKNKRKGKI
ncbi:hypothetical protein AM232_13850 [Bacillus sp. FJAT-21352]|nr:hypothetical protein AM232_13850 [Bacillus sp. FJAT-21352]